MSILDFLSPGKQAAELVTGVVASVGKALQDLGIIGLNDMQKAKVFAEVNKVIGEYNDKVLRAYEAEVGDIDSARKMSMVALGDAPRWIKGAAALVTPFGGIGALTIFFGNIFAGWTGWFMRIPLTTPEQITLDIIITFFFGYRMVSKLTGIAGKF